MRVVFMGTPAFAARVLQTLCEAHEVVGVFTRPDAVRGRGAALVASDVKSCALERGIPVVEASSFKEEGALEALRAFDSQIVVVAAYGALLPPAVLELPPLGCINVHASALPRWRGAAPIERAILAGDGQLGVCIMRMEQGLDTGAYCASRMVEASDKGKLQLEDELACAGGQALLEALERIEQGTAVWTEQDEELATYARKIEKGELDLSPHLEAEDCARRVRASSDAHSSRARIAGRICAIEAVRVLGPDEEGGFADLHAGEAAFRGKRLVARCAQGAFEIVQLKPQGKKSMDGKSFCAGVQNAKHTIIEWGAE